MDFETSQNLIIGNINKDIIALTLKDKTSCDLTTHRLGGLKLYDEGHDTITKYEVPNRFKYTHTVTIPQTNEPQLMRPTKITEKHILPGATGLESTENVTFSNLKPYLSGSFSSKNAQQVEVLKESNQGIRNMCSYPGLLLGQPYVPDHTGQMKFKYYIRITTIMDTSITLKSDNYRAEDWRTPEQRQYTNWPAYEFKSGKKEGLMMIYPYLI